MDKAKIMVVDDEVRLCDSLDILLGERGYDVQCFTDGKGAISYVQDKPCDLVLLDLIMPELDGYAVLEFIKKVIPDLPVIIMTAQGSAEYAVKALKGGAEDYICKPFDIEELIRRIENALEKKRLHHEHAVMTGKLAVTEAQLRQAQKMEAIATLAGGIAHDFNNILMGLQGHISIMKFQLDEKHPFRARMENMEKLIESGSKLTAQLLGYARRGRYEVRPINLNEVVSLAVETFRQIHKEIVFDIDLDPNLPQMEADAGQMEQVLMNLLVNAADAMPDGGRVAIRTGTTELTSTSGMHFPVKPGTYVCMSVRDEGMGIEEAIRERIFEPFFTTKEMGRGTGLGLASVYGIVKGHNGYIDVKSRVGEGTCFYLYFPVIEKQVVNVTGNPPGEIINGAGGVVLLVDDEEEILKVGKTILEFMGYEVLVAPGGQEALDIYNVQKNNINLVILDVVMPGMSGAAVFDKLREMDPTIPIILMSGYSRDREATSQLIIKSHGFLQKPFNIHELSQAIQQALPKRRKRVTR